MCSPAGSQPVPQQTLVAELNDKLSYIRDRLNLAGNKAEALHFAIFGTAGPEPTAKLAEAVGGKTATQVACASLTLGAQVDGIVSELDRLLSIQRGLERVA